MATADVKMHCGTGTELGNLRHGTKQEFLGSILYKVCTAGLGERNMKYNICPALTGASKQFEIFASRHCEHAHWYKS